jgi:hypothetical protein
VDINAVFNSMLDDTLIGFPFKNAPLPLLNETWLISFHHYIIVIDTNLIAVKSSDNIGA